MCNQKSYPRQTKGYKAKCVTKWCRRPRGKGRFCNKCETNNKKERNPLRYWFNVNKSNANRRARQFGTGKFWKVSFEYWVEFNEETGYILLKGKGREDYTLDCRENELGYIDGNLQLLPNWQNASKGKRPVKNLLTGEWDVVEFNPPPVAEDLPF